jgi:hypothetical protein
MLLEASPEQAPLPGKSDTRKKNTAGIIIENGKNDCKRDPSGRHKDCFISYKEGQDSVLSG